MITLRRLAGGSAARSADGGSAYRLADRGQGVSLWISTVFRINTWHVSDYPNRFGKP